eukprot:gene9090-18833_t
MGDSSADKAPSRILDYLYLGGRIHAKNRDLLRKLNINHILNCTPQRSVDPEAGCPNFFEKEKTITYKRIPIFDNRGEDIIAHMETAFHFIEQGKHYGAVLVHCHKGVSRSASFVIGYLMRKNGFTFNEALNHVQSCRPIVQPNYSFTSQLEKYESILKEQAESAEEQYIQSHRSDARKNEHQSFAGPDIGPSVPITSPFPTVDIGPTAPTAVAVVDVAEAQELPSIECAPVQLQVEALVPAGNTIASVDEVQTVVVDTPSSITTPHDSIEVGGGEEEESDMTRKRRSCRNLEIPMEL